MKVALLLFLLTGCAAQRLVVSQIDTVIEFQTGSKLGLYSRQKDALEKDVSAFLKELQKEVPGWQAKLLAFDPQRPEGLETFWAQLQEQYGAVSQGYVRVLSRYLAQLDASQQKSFFLVMKEENDEIRESPVQPKKLAERVEYFFGEVSAQQEQVLTRFVPILKERQAARLKRREDLHERLKGIYAESGPKEEKIRGAFEDYQGRMLADQRPLLKMYQEILQGITPKQASAFKERQQELSELLGHFGKGDY